jgi:cytochrome P450
LTLSSKPTSQKTWQQNPPRLDPEFRAFAIRQIRLFLFAGHDSTSSTICYALHLLSTNPATLSSLRAEQDEILGPSVSTPSTLTQQPHLVNSLPYTTAVIKEAMRLFPPASASRRGKPHQSLTSDQGHICPTDYAMIWMVHIETHRSAEYWTRPDEFLPERWLVPPGHTLYPAVKGAWRPFEHGPRNCLAQGQVMVEFRVILACIVRELDFRSAYDEFDRLHPRGGLKTHRGERVYQIEEGAAHPVDHYPCRVSLARR